MRPRQLPFRPEAATQSNTRLSNVLLLNCAAWPRTIRPPASW